MKVSIIIPNYNGEKYLRECLSSLVTQTYRDYEVIIIDNCSTDGSLVIMAEFTHPKLKVINNPKNEGFAKAVNQGIKMASGDYVALLNNDTQAEQDWLLHLVQLIDKDIKIFSASSKMIRYYEREVIDDAGDEFTILGWAYKRGDGQNRSLYTKPREIFSSCAGAAIYRRKVFEEIGLFDENFFAYLEDIDIGYRARIYGYKNYYCPDAIVYHIGSATSGSKHNDFKVKISARNNVYLIKKNMPVLQLILNLPFIMFGFLVKGCFFSLKGYGVAYFTGLWEGLVNHHKIEKVKTSRDHLGNYIKIEFLLLINLIKFIRQKSKIG